MFSTTKIRTAAVLLAATLALTAAGPASATEIKGPSQPSTVQPTSPPTSSASEGRGETAEVPVIQTKSRGSGA